MSAPGKILLILLVLSSRISFAQQPGPERQDTSISIFWNPDLKVRIRIFNPEEPDRGKMNSVLELFSARKEPEQERIFFRDSMFASMLQIRLADFNGDGVKDLLVYHLNESKENPTYHLYLVNPSEGRLKRVRGFERVYNPYYDHSRCLIYGVDSYERQMVTREYIVNKEGILAYVRPR